jgi:hypothetical protein
VRISIQAPVRISIRASNNTHIIFHNDVYDRDDNSSCRPETLWVPNSTSVGSLVVKNFRVAPPSPGFDSPRERIFRLG